MPTLYFPTNNKPLVTFSLNGDFTSSNFSQWRMKLTSKYTNKDLGTLEYDLNVIQANERYTEFTFSLNDSEAISELEASGYYTYEIFGRNSGGGSSILTDILLGEGELKMVTENTANTQRSNKPETIKYKTEPNTAKSYIIYN